VPGIVSNLSEAFSPVMTAPSKDFHRLVHDVHLDAVAIELDFVEPSLAARHLLDRGSQCWFDEARIGTFSPGCGWLFALEGHGYTRRAANWR